MIVKIDFNSDEAIYIQLRNQIIMGIATDRIREEILCPLYGRWQSMWESICIQSIRPIPYSARKAF